MAKIFGQLEKAQLENTTSDTGSLPKGFITYRTDLNQAKISNGTSMITVADLTTAQTMTNKTLSGAILGSAIVSDALILTEVATPATPASGFGKIYFKSDGFLYQLNDSGTESQVPQAGAGLTGFRNRLINGGMGIDQRNDGAAQTITAGAALAYTVDRWYAYCTGANVTGQRIAGASQSQFRYRFTGAASVTAINFAQRIEAFNSYDMNGTTATLSVDLANSLLTSVAWEAYYANTTDTFGTIASPTVTSIASGTFTVNSTVSRYSTQISIPAAATTGLQIRLAVGAQTSGTWTIGDVQLEPGSAGTLFEQRPRGFELGQCLRYLPAFRSTSTNATTNWIGFGATTTAATGSFKLPIQARTPPTGLVVSAASHFTLSRPSTGNVVATAVNFAVASKDAVQVEFNTASGLVADIGYYAYMNNTAGYILFNGCEL